MHVWMYVCHTNTFSSKECSRNEGMNPSMEIKIGGVPIIELHSHFDNDQSVHAFKGHQNMHDWYVFHRRSDLRQMS